MAGDPEDKNRKGDEADIPELPISGDSNSGESTSEDAKQDFDKIDFTSEGETLGYISLDQARVMALRLAREDTEIYGERYSVLFRYNPF